MWIDWRLSTRLGKEVGRHNIKRFGLALPSTTKAGLVVIVWIVEVCDDRILHLQRSEQREHPAFVGVVDPLWMRHRLRDHDVYSGTKLTRCPDEPVGVSSCTPSS
ncbi:hypothetical protein [uncultured Sphingomonas sp.]|uniref:hypothetical protein n=1 Tax=uncultured Sphingomonas sp. TaxID=158754 RepID=UPI0035CAC213